MTGNIKDTFDKIHAEEKLKENTKEFLAEKARKYEKKHHFTYGHFAAIACCAVLLLCIGGGFSYFTPVSAISVDINPSIELGVNRFDKVISVNAYNEDGEELADLLNIKYKNYEKAVEEMLENEAVRTYLSKNELLSFTVVGADDAQSTEMLNTLNACTQSHKNVCCYKGNSEEVDDAHEAGLSFGKYQAFLKLQSLNPSITVEDVQGLTMRQIHDMIDECTDSDTHSTDDSDNHTPNSGKGNGLQKRKHGSHQSCE